MILKFNKKAAFNVCFFLVLVISLCLFLCVYVKGCNISEKNDDFWGSTMNFPIECILFAPIFIGEIEAYRDLRYFLFKHPKSKVSTVFTTLTMILAFLILAADLVAYTIRFTNDSYMAVLSMLFAWSGVFILLFIRSIYGVVNLVKSKRKS